MAIHIIKLVVGVSSLEEFAAIQEHYRVPYKGGMAVPVWTRYCPARAEEVFDGGSLYRVIKNRIVCRQRILGLEQARHPVKGTMCNIMVDPAIIRTVAQPKKAFQGWRYLKVADVPADIGEYVAGEGEPPEEMAEALRETGLL